MSEYLPYVIFALCAARITQKAGYSPLWGLLGLHPITAFLALWGFAFADWPVIGRARIRP